MTDKSDYRLRPLITADIDTIYEWRTKPHVADYMFTGADITMEQHEKWFRRIQEDDKVEYRILMYQGEPIGLANAVDIDPAERSCFWGFYIGEESAPKGSGAIMGELMIEHIFKKYEDVDTIFGEAFKFNEASLRLHEKLGFEQRPDLFYEELKSGKPEEIIVMQLDRENYA